MKEITEYDKHNNLIHYRNSNGYEYWYEYDEKGNLIHSRNANGYESWREYDENNNEIHYRNSSGDEWWYDEDGNEIEKPNPTTAETERAEIVRAEKYAVLTEYAEYCDSFVISGRGIDGENVRNFRDIYYGR